MCRKLFVPPALCLCCFDSGPLSLMEPLVPIQFTHHTVATFLNHEKVVTWLRNPQWLPDLVVHNNRNNFCPLQSSPSVPGTLAVFTPSF